MNNFTCFLIDDDVDDREIFYAVIKDLAPPCNCVHAVNGQVALDMLEAGNVSPDIIFLDLNMPLMNGQHFLQELNRRRIVPDIPIVVLTTSADLGTKATMLDAGAKEFITKPDKFSDWEKVLKHAIGDFL